MNQFETFLVALLGGALSLWEGHLMAAPITAVLFGGALGVLGGVMLAEPVVTMIRRGYDAGSTRGSNGIKLNLNLRLWPFGRGDSGNGKHNTAPVAPCKAWQVNSEIAAGACKEWVDTHLLWNGRRHSQGLI